MTPSDRNGDALDDLDSSSPATPPRASARSVARSAADPRDDETTSMPTTSARGRRPAKNGAAAKNGARTRAKSTVQSDQNGAARRDEPTVGVDHTAEITTVVAATPLATEQPVTSPLAVLYDGETDASPSTQPVERIDEAPAPPPVRAATTVIPVAQSSRNGSLDSGEPSPARAPQGPVLWRRRPRVRRVTRVVRHVDPWSIFKIALVFSAVLYGVCLTAGVLLWEVAQSTGTVDNVERFLESGGWETFEFKGGELYHNLWIGGLFAAAGLVGLAVLGATLFNLITDLVGGIRVTVLEEEVVTHETARPGRWQAVRAKLIPEVDGAAGASAPADVVEAPPPRNSAEPSA